MDDQQEEVDLDAMLAELGVEVPPPSSFAEAFQKHNVDVGRHYAMYRCSMLPKEALLEACKAVFTDTEYLGFEKFIDSGENSPDPALRQLITMKLDELIDLGEKYYDLIYNVQPSELPTREPMDLVDLSELWAADLRAWMAPADEPSDYWVKVAASSIVDKALASARTRTGKKVKLDQAVFVIKRVQSKHRQAGDKAGVVSCTALIERIQNAKI